MPVRTLKPAAARRPQLGRPRHTSRERILEVALELLDRRGPQALSLSTVAAELGMGISSLYTYFRNIADLEDEVAAHLIAQVPAVDAAPAPVLRAQLVTFGMALLHMHAVHPYLRLIAGPATARIGARLRRGNLAALMALGVDAQRANDCLEVIQGLAYSGGSELHRLQRAPAATLRRVAKVVRDEISAQLVQAAGGKESTDQRHRRLLERCVDGLLPELQGAKHGVRRAR